MRLNYDVYAGVSPDLTTGEFLARRSQLFSEIAKHIPDRAKLKTANMEIFDGTAEDIFTVRKAANTAKISFSMTLRPCYTAREIQRARFIRLAVEGEPIDVDIEGRGLNVFPKVLCDSCHMPDELSLPSPFKICAKAISKATENYWGEGKLQANRDIYSGECGVLIISSRLRQLLDETTHSSMASSPVISEQGRELPYFAIRPNIEWGIEEDRVELSNCSSCGRAVVARLREHNSEVIDQRLRVRYRELPEADIVCAEGWFGDRRAAPSGFHRDVFISGRLYSFLMSSSVRGLCPPADLVWVGDSVPMFSTGTIQRIPK